MTDSKPKAGAMADKKLTPLMQQYWDVKTAHPDKIILFRMGDFYEMFHRDAEQAAPVLGIALTSRNKKAQDETPMCGVPHHAAPTIINKLLAAGFKVAICDQLEDPKFAKGLVKRGITRVLSPGMVYDPETLDATRAHYLASWDETGALAFFDVSTGEGFFFRSVTEIKRHEFLESLQPIEWILTSDETEKPELKTLASRLGVTLTSCSDLKWRAADGSELVLPGDGEKLFEALTLDQPDAVQRLLAYSIGQFAQDEAVRWVKSLSRFEERRLEGRMVLSGSTLRHLEVFETYKGERLGSLVGAIDRTKTSGGARLLKSWLQFPLVEKVAIEKRLDRVERWMKEKAVRKDVRQRLAGVGDLPRRLGKISQPSRGPRDLISLAASIEAGLEAAAVAGKADVEAKAWHGLHAAKVNEVSDEIRRVLNDEPPLLVRQGGAIRIGANSVLDELITLATDSSRLILELEAREREATGIASLKVRYNNVFGYSIEITNTHKERVPRDRYERKQTLANAERYTTQELTELEGKVLSAEEKRIKLEEEEFAKLVQFVLSRSQDLLRFSHVLGELDVMSALAHVADEHRYIRPRFHNEVRVHVEGSRHPVVEQALSKPFVANDIALAEGGCLLLTGPNMAGKSTLMRQVAVTVLMAQIGSFVAAKTASLPILERVSTRIGASDFLAEGLSTFMVEMKETAELLSSATERTLVVLDEIGRGTSTFDGMSLAQAILEHLLTEKQCLTLFATHYHELTALQAQYPRLQNGHMAVHEKDGVITFLHRLSEGAAGQSYGIHVAKLAGLPQSITRRAESILNGILSTSQEAREEKRELAQMTQASPQMALTMFLEPSPLSELETRILKEIRSFDANRSTPLQALGKISEWVQELEPT